MFDLIVGYGWGVVQLAFGFALLFAGISGLIKRFKDNTNHPASLWKSTGFSNQARRGFVIAPILYLLGMIGVLGGVFFSSYSQQLRSTQTIQNNIIVKSDLQAATNTLSAQGVFSTNGLTLCPPRSTHQTTGNPCAAAPISLIQFADYSGNQLPANYANAATTGSPAEVGVFAAGAGIKVLDAYGHTYIYCRWENLRSNPSANAFVLLSAGADGKLQTKCGDSSVQGDDGYLALSVATAINRAALWQANGGNVTYGATGTQVSIDSSGDVIAAGNVTALSASITNGLTSSSLTSGAISGSSLSSSGSVTGSSGSFGSLSASSAAITNGITATTVTTSGDISAKDFVAIGTVSAATGSFGAINGTSASITNGLTALNLTASGAVTGASGSFTTLSGSSASITNGLTATNLTASNTVTAATGNITTLNSTNATVTGTLTANNLALSGSVTAGSSSFSNLSVTSLTASSNISGNNISASNNVTVGSTLSAVNINASHNIMASNNITATGTVSAGTGSFTTLNANGGIINGDFEVTGVTSLDGGATAYNDIGLTDSGLDFWTSSNGGNWHYLYETTPGTGSSILNIGTLEWTGYVDFYVGSNAGGGTVAQIGCNPCGGSALPGGNFKLYGTAASAGAMPTNVDIEANAVSFFNGGSVGIGTSNPKATLDVYGYAKLLAQTSAPTTCASSNKGAIAMTTNNGLCFCNGSAWRKVDSPTTACAW